MNKKLVIKYLNSIAFMLLEIIEFLEKEYNDEKQDVTV